MSQRVSSPERTENEGGWKEKQTCDTFCKDVIISNRHKIMLTCFNVYFMGIGLTYLYFAFYYWFYREELDPDDVFYLRVVSGILLVTGLCIISASILGTAGYFLGKTWMLRYMMVIHLCAAVVLFSAAIYIQQYIMYRTEKSAERYLEERYYMYYYDMGAQTDVDTIQRSLECCGIYGPRSFPRSKVPASCCSNMKDDCIPLYQHRTECNHAYGKFQVSKLNELTWVVIFVGMTHIFGAIATYFPAVMIKRRLKENNSTNNES